MQVFGLYIRQQIEIMKNIKREHGVHKNAASKALTTQFQHLQKCLPSLLVLLEVSNNVGSLHVHSSFVIDEDTDELGIPHHQRALDLFIGRSQFGGGRERSQLQKRRWRWRSKKMDQKKTSLYSNKTSKKIVTGLDNPSLTLDQKITHLNFVMTKNIPKFLQWRISNFSIFIRTKNIF